MSADVTPAGFRYFRRIRLGRAREPVSWTGKDRDGTERDIRKGLPDLPGPADALANDEDRFRWEDAAPWS